MAGPREDLISLRCSSAPWRSRAVSAAFPGARAHHAALDAVEQHAFDVVFADLRMPDLGGVGLRERLAQTHPTLAARTVLMTGDTVIGVEMARGDANGREAPVLEKPFSIVDARAHLDRMLAKGEL